MFVGVYESNGDKDRAKDSQSFYHWSLVNIKWLSFKLLKTVIEPLQPLQQFGINFTEKPMITVIVLIKDLKFYRYNDSYVLLFFHYIYYFAHFFSFSSACHCCFYCGAPLSPPFLLDSPSSPFSGCFNIYNQLKITGPRLICKLITSTLP